MKPEVAFGKVLKTLRTAQAISQDQFAHKCSLDRTFISMLERGQRQPSLTSILVISQALEITPMKILELTTDMIDENNKD